MNKNNFTLFLFGIILISSLISATLSLNINNINNNNNNNSDEELITTTNKCQICELVVKDVIDCLTSNMTVKEIETGLNLLCFRIMPFHSKPCRQFVDSNIEKIVQIIEDNGDPNEVCSSIGACSSSDANNIISNQNNKNFPNKNHK